MSKETVKPNNIKVLYTTVLITLTLLIYITSLSLVTYDNNIWYLQASNNFNVPDFHFSGFGVALASIGCLSLGMSVYYISKQTSINNKNNVERGCISKIMFLILPLFLTSYALVYPLMCGLNSILTGGILMAITAGLCLIFNIYVFFSFDLISSMGCLIFTLITAMETIVLFMNK